MTDTKVVKPQQFHALLNNLHLCHMYVGYVIKKKHC